MLVAPYMALPSFFIVILTEIYYNVNVTLSWDSTSVEGHHINEVHISIATVPPTSYVLQLGTLAGCTTDDFSSPILMLL